MAPLTQNQLSNLDKTEEDFSDPNCTGIKAVVRNMSAKEKVMEWQRWQMDILARVPDQPGFEELGMGVGMVFYGKERRARAEKESEERRVREEEKRKVREEEEMRLREEKEEMDIDEDDDAVGGEVIEMNGLEVAKVNNDDDDNNDEEHDDDDNANDDDEEDSKIHEEEEVAIKEDKNLNSDGDSDDDDDEEEGEIHEENEVANKKDKNHNSDGDDNDDDDDDEEEGEIHEENEVANNKDKNLNSDGDDNNDDDDDDDDDDENNDDDEEEGEIHEKNEMANNKDKNHNSVGDDNDDDDDDDDNHDSDDSTSNKTKDSTEDDEPPKKRKPFLLQPIPSFYNQDHQRLVHIHADILNCALHEEARMKINDATKEYNKHFQQSNEIQNQKLHIDTERSNATYQCRLQFNKVTKEKTLKIAIAKSQWQRRKEEFEATARHRRQVNLQKMMYNRKSCNVHPDIVAAMNMKDEDVVRRSLAGAVDRVVIQNAPKEFAIGTSYSATEALRNRHDGIRSMVATSLSHCVDVVVNRIEQGWVQDEHLDTTLVNYEQYPPFQPPASIANSNNNNSCFDTIIVNDRNETLKCVETRTQAELRILAKSLQRSETERQKSWKNVMEVKAEFGQPPQKGGGGVDAMSKIPALNLTTPRLKISRSGGGSSGGGGSSSKKRTASALAVAAATASMRTSASSSSKLISSSSNHRTTIPISQSKYSADKVKARIYSDGSVMPVSQPKKTKDGLYMRPAGRQRKGMDWDAVIGKWVLAGKATKTGNELRG